MGRYEHIQHGWFHWILHMLGLVPLTLGITLRSEFEGGWLATVAVGVLMELVATCFWHLRVRDEGDVLGVAFGPLRVFSKRIPYGSLREFRPERTSILDGWGVRWRPGAGWLWNLGGFDCIRFLDDRGRSFRVGTDDPEGLLEHLTARVPHAAPRAEAVAS